MSTGSIASPRTLRQDLAKVATEKETSDDKVLSSEQALKMKSPEGNQKYGIKGENEGLSRKNPKNYKAENVQKEILLIEMRLLLCRQILDQIKRSTFDSNKKVADDKYKSDNEDVETKDDLPREDEVSNKFTTDQIRCLEPANDRCCDPGPKDEPL